MFMASTSGKIDCAMIGPSCPISITRKSLDVWHRYSREFVCSRKLSKRQPWCYKWRQQWHHDNSTVLVVRLDNADIHLSMSLITMPPWHSVKFFSLICCCVHTILNSPGVWCPVSGAANLVDNAGLILGLRSANVRRRYKVTSSLIGWAQT